jgi:hypothetical protein
MKQRFFFLLFLLCIVSCNSDKEPAQEEWLELFNGTDLSGWYTWQRAPEPGSYMEGIPRDENGNYLEPIGRNNDPLNVFTVVSEENQPAIRISGETFGILVTENEFENYHLRLEFKWGDEKYPPREDELMDSGVLYHSVGPEGAWGGVWMKSFECQVMEQACGDFICVDTVLADIPAVRPSAEARFQYNPVAEKVTFGPEQSYCRKDEDHEKPMGYWNLLEIYTLGGESVHVINGEITMHCYNLRHLENGRELPLTRGKIQLQSEGAEIFYRNIEITQIDEFPERF